jgi:hypothetical protein
MFFNPDPVVRQTSQQNNESFFEILEQTIIKSRAYERDPESANVFWVTFKT